MMRFKKGFFKNYLSKDQSLDLKALSDDLVSSEESLSEFRLLEEASSNLLFAAFCELERFDAIEKILENQDIENLNLNPALIYKALILINKDTELDFEAIQNLHDHMSPEQSLDLLPFKNQLPDLLKKKVEVGLLEQKTRLDQHRNDLKDEIAFLKQEKLFEKALEKEEILNKTYKQEEQHTVTEAPIHSTADSKTLSFSKIIERNLSFETRNQKRKKADFSYQDQIKEEEKLSVSMAKAWAEAFAGSDLETLLTQIEFLNINAPDLYSKLLKEDKLSHWDKIDLYIKSKKFFEGLSYLDQHEAEFLGSGSKDSIYAFYYAKAVLLIGAGMRTEAEEILKAISEQNENYRDIKSLLKN